MDERGRGQSSERVSSGIGIAPIRFHDLRATFITQLSQYGVSIAEVQVIVGHPELKTTQRYLSVAGVDVKGVTNKLQFSMPSGIDNVISLRDRVGLSGTQCSVNPCVFLDFAARTITVSSPVFRPFS